MGMGQYRLSKMLAFAFSLSLMSSSAAGTTPVENAFLVRIPGELCTGTVVAMNWVLTAAHCFGRRMSSGRRNEHEDVVIEGRQGDYVYRYMHFVDFLKGSPNSLCSTYTRHILLADPLHCHLRKFTPGQNHTQRDSPLGTHLRRSL